MKGSVSEDPWATWWVVGGTDETSRVAWQVVDVGVDVDKDPWRVSMDGLSRQAPYAAVLDVPAEQVVLNEDMAWQVPRVDVAGQERRDQAQCQPLAGSR